MSLYVNIGKHKIHYRKTHDYRVFLERLLPLAVCELLPKHVSYALIKFSKVFKELCSKVLRLEDLKHMESQISVTLWKLERIFPLAFFDIMVYLPIHYLGKLKLLVRCNIDGCIRLKGKISSYLLLVYLNYVLILIRCIYMYLCKLKCYVQNKAHPEGSIAEGYQADECLTFCSWYLHGIKTIFNLS